MKGLVMLVVNTGLYQGVLDTDQHWGERCLSETGTQIWTHSIIEKLHPPINSRTHLFIQ